MSDNDKLIWDPNAPEAKPETLTIRNVKFSYFPQELIDLRIEIQKHPNLLLLLHTQHDKDVYIQILEIATYCGILVAGTFDQQGMLDLCKMCTEKLFKMRAIYV